MGPAVGGSRFHTRWRYRCESSAVSDQMQTLWTAVGGRVMAPPLDVAGGSINALSSSRCGSLGQ